MYDTLVYSMRASGKPQRLGYETIDVISVQ